MPLSFLLHLHDDFFNNWIKTTSPFSKVKLGMLTKTPHRCTHQFCRMAKSICRMNWHSASSKSVGIFVVKQWICPITERILHWFQKHCISQAFLCLMVIFHKALHLGDNICGRFKAVSIKYLLQDIQKHKISDCFADGSILQMCRKIRCLSATA